MLADAGARRSKRVGDTLMKGQNFGKPHGMLVFRSLEDAVRNGFQCYDRLSGYYIVRAGTPAGWALALVEDAP